MLDSIEKESFYIHMHPYAKPMIRYRMRNILKERNPDFQFTDSLVGLVSGKAALKKAWYALTHF